MPSLNPFFYRRLAMEKHSTVVASFTIGVDLGDRRSHACVVDGEGKVVETFSVLTDAANFEKKFKRERCRIVIEAGTHSPWVSRRLEELGHEVLVAHPRAVRAIYQSDGKDDVKDAEMLARLGRADPQLLHPIRHRGVKVQEDLALIRGRDHMVRARTQLINGVRGLMKSAGARAPSGGSESFHKKVLLHVPEGLKPGLMPMVEMAEELTKRIKDYDRAVEYLAETRYPASKTMMQIRGVGALTTLSYMLVLEDPAKFERSRSAAAYVGLVPRRDQSGATNKQLRITKAGSSLVRRLLVTSAQYILGPFGSDSDLRRFGLELAKRGGKAAKKRAVVAVARKLATLMHRLWVTGEVYEPLRAARLRGEIPGETAGAAQIPEEIKMPTPPQPGPPRRETTARLDRHELSLKAAGRAGRWKPGLPRNPVMV